MKNFESLQSLEIPMQRSKADSQKQPTQIIDWSSLARILKIIPSEEFRTLKIQIGSVKTV